MSVELLRQTAEQYQSNRSRFKVSDIEDFRLSDDVLSIKPSELKSFADDPDEEKSKYESMGFAFRLGITDTLRGLSQITGLGFDEDHIFLNPNKEEITNQFLDSTCILVDDREKYIVKFTDQNLQNPGIGVHHTPKASMNGVNNSLNKLKEIIKTS